MKKTILLVEDNQMLLDMYTLKFSESGYTVLQANNGKDGYEIAKEKKPDVILLDIILPQMDGFTVKENLNKSPETKKIPVFFLTNLKQDEDVKRGKELGVVDYLVKAELVPSQVLEKVENFLKNNK